MSAATAGVLFIFIVFLATLVQSLVEAILGQPIDFIPGQVIKKWKPIILRYLAMLVGVGLSFHYELDLIYVIWSLLQESVQLQLPNITASWVGFLLTGLSIGQGAIWLHDLVKKIIPPSAPTLRGI